MDSIKQLQGMIAVITLPVMDALNVRCLCFYEYALETSPNMDQMARERLLLTNQVSNSSWTRPSFTISFTRLPKKVTMRSRLTFIDGSRAS